jgi:hypothetical protein
VGALRHPDRRSCLIDVSAADPSERDQHEWLDYDDRVPRDVLLERTTGTLAEERPQVINVGGITMAESRAPEAVDKMMWRLGALLQKTEVIARGPRSFMRAGKNSNKRRV